MDISTVDINEYIAMSVGEKYKYLCEKIKGTHCKARLLNNEIKIRDKNNIDFVFVPGGDFYQGLSEEEYKIIQESCEKGIVDVNELRPQIKVNVKDLLVSKTPVTNFQLTMLGYLHTNENTAAYVEKSVVDEVCKKAGYRILSESEWEYLARAGRQDLFTFGNTILNDKDMDMWLNMDFSDFNKCKANRLGLYGLFTGDWCSNHYKYSYQDLNETKDFTIRGGGAFFWPWQAEEWIWCMSAMRMPSSGLIDNSCGFHFVIDVS